MRALIVEDQKKEGEAIEKIVAKVQKTEGTWCGTAEDALALLQTEKFDLFILDVQLPGADGFSLANQIRSQIEYQLTPILFVTGSDRSPLEAFKKYHCYDYIEKPFRQKELYDKLSELILSIAYQKNEPTHSKQEMVCISSRNGDFYLNKDKFLFVEIQNGNAIFYLSDKIIKISGVSLLGVLEDFNDEFVLRCHKSFALNIRRIQSIHSINYRLWAASFEHTEKTADIGLKYYGAVQSAMKRLAASIGGDQ
ncbi:LytR/AlgR family response regulator transcription factor [Aminipila luticellarii]|uniref:Stage 0 sporulation protein A homolog n=1 Tax=Aminipila luticellarii TaxID=2507160 RepID=A0A410PWM2_9FIRM|nr:LytTR family DNA-binding domain-containing protein [Aminipila luticellarii]QAT43342.1 DNA-binding response regulator [Aminipila luticellarii]